MANPDITIKEPASKNFLDSIKKNVVALPHSDDGADDWIDGRYVGPDRPLPTGELESMMEGLFAHVAYLNSWFRKHEQILESVDGLPVSSVYDHFIDASCMAKSLARMAGFEIDYATINARDWTPKTRPQRPEVGPQARYTMTGHSIGFGTDDPAVHFMDGKVLMEAGLEWTLYYLERFDEPSRHNILASTACHFGMPFDVLMGGML